MTRFALRLFWLLVFLLGLPPVFLLLALCLFVHDIPRLFWGILYATELPEPGWPFVWWIAYCGDKGNRA